MFFSVTLDVGNFVHVDRGDPGAEQITSFWDLVHAISVISSQRNRFYEIYTATTEVCCCREHHVTCDAIMTRYTPCLCVADVHGDRARQQHEPLQRHQRLLPPLALQPAPQARPLHLHASVSLTELTTPVSRARDVTRRIFFFSAYFK